MAKSGETICWRMISGRDIDGKPIYNDWAVGEVIGPDETDPNLIEVRRTSYPGGIVLVRKDMIVL